MGHRRVRLLVIILGLFFIVATVQATIGLLGAGKKVTDAQAEVDKLAAENEKLKEEAAKVQTPQFIEEQARDKLNWVKEGEDIVIIPPELLAATPEAKPINIPNWQKWLNLIF